MSLNSKPKPTLANDTIQGCLIPGAPPTKAMLRVVVRPTSNVLLLKALFQEIREAMDEFEYLGGRVQTELSETVYFNQHSQQSA